MSAGANKAATILHEGFITKGDPFIDYNFYQDPINSNCYLALHKKLEDVACVYIDQDDAEFGDNPEMALADVQDRHLMPETP